MEFHAAKSALPDLVKLRVKGSRREVGKKFRDFRGRYHFHSNDRHEKGKDQDYLSSRRETWPTYSL